ncbi:MAG: hypothetical protein WCV68_02995 [Candidatus Paceibacterota bacterium]
MAEETSETNEQDRLAKAKLVLSGEEKLMSWKKTSEDFERRRQEAAKAMASDEQKKAWDDAEKARLGKIEAQKKLADLEAARKIKEEEEKNKIGQEQTVKDAEAEALRVAKINEILKSQEEINLIKKSPNAGPAAIKTLTRDIGETIGREGLSVSKIVTQTPDKENLAKKEKSVTNRSWLVGIGVLLIIGGLIALVWAIGQRQTTSLATVKVTRQGLIFSDKQQAINLDQETATQIREELREKSLTPPAGKESIEEIYFTYQIKEQTQTGLVMKMVEADPTAIAGKLELKLPDDFLRSLEPKLMLGFYYGEQTSPFYILKTKNYKNVASAILSNENIIISELLAPFEDASSTEKILNTPLQDKMIKNYDTRLVVDETNTIIAVYSWIDKETLVVTINEGTLAKVISSYSSPR